MPSTSSLLPLLRPLAAPVPRQASHQFLRFSTATRLRGPQNPPTTTPQTTPTAPSPSTSPSRAADLAAAEAVTDADSAQPPAPKPTILPSQRDSNAASTTPNLDQATIAQLIEDVRKSGSKQKTRTWSPSDKSFSPPSLAHLPPPKYHIARTPSKNLPVYMDYKRGGNLHLTTIRKITGDLHALKEEVTEYLNKKTDEVKINSLTGHVIVKGKHTAKINEFLAARGF